MAEEEEDREGVDADGAREQRLAEGDVGDDCEGFAEEADALLLHRSVNSASILRSLGDLFTFARAICFGTNPGPVGVIINPKKELAKAEDVVEPEPKQGKTDATPGHESPEFPL